MRTDSSQLRASSSVRPHSRARSTNGTRRSRTLLPCSNVPFAVNPYALAARRPSSAPSTAPAPPGSRRRTCPPRPRCRRPGWRRSRRPGRSSRGRPVHRLLATLHQRPAVDLLRLGVQVRAAARCRRASSRSAAPASARPRCSGGTRRRAGRRCRRGPSGRACAAHHRAAPRVPAAATPRRSERQVHRVRELRRAAEAAVARSNARASARPRRPRRRRSTGVTASEPVRSRSARSPCWNCSGLLERPRRALLVQASRSASRSAEAGPPVRGLGREVGAAVERLQVRA